MAPSFGRGGCPRLGYLAVLLLAGLVLLSAVFQTSLSGYILDRNGKREGAADEGVGVASGTNTSSSHKRAFVSLMVPAPGLHRIEAYINQLELMRCHLEHYTTDPLIVLTDGEVPLPPSLRAKRVSVLKPSQSRNKKYLTQPTKFHLWNLTEYDRVAYLDSDLVLLGNASLLWDACAEANNASLCAVEDTPAEERLKRQPPYLNAGLLVTFPNRSTFHTLRSHVEDTGTRLLAEQDVLNEVFRDRWARLPPHLNLFDSPRLRNRHHRASNELEIWHAKLFAASDVPRALRRAVRDGKVPQDCWDAFVHEQFHKTRVRHIYIACITIACFSSFFACLLLCSRGGRSAKPPAHSM